MNELTRAGKNWLIHSTKSEFYDVISEAKLSPRQVKVCTLKFLDNLMNYQIAMQLNVSVKTVEKDLQKIYIAVNRILK